MSDQRELAVNISFRIASLITLISFVFVLVLPQPASAEGVCSLSFSPEDERVLGKKFLLMVQSQLPLITDPDIISYVEKLGNSILAQTGPQLFNYKFYVVKDEALNAFAAPSGLVFIHSGLLENIDDESELAGIIAHEIGHVTARHLARRMERMQKLGLLAMAGMLAGVFLGGGAKAGQAIASGALAASSTLALKYSQEDEEEADRMAFKWMQAAGYDVRGMVSMFKKIRRYRFLGSPTIPSYMSTHPALEERISYLEDLILSHPSPAVEKDAAALRRCQIQIALALKTPAKLREKWQAKLKKKPDPYLYYAVALTHQAEKQYEMANKFLDKAASLGMSKSLLRGERGINALGSGKPAEAVPLLREAMEENPHAARYQLHLARAYRELGQIEEALSTFERIKESFPYYAESYYHLGLIHGERGETGPAEYHIGMYYYLTGDYQSAVKHLNQALSDGSLTPARRTEIKETLAAIREVSS